MNDNHRPGGASDGGQFGPNIHSEPDSSLRSSLGQPTARERFEARQEVGKAVREPFRTLLAGMPPRPQDFAFKANHEGILVGVALDPAGKEIPGSRELVGAALLEAGIPAEHLLSPADNGRLVVACSEAFDWGRLEDEDFGTAEGEAAAAPQPGALPPLPFPTRKTKPQASTRPTPPPGYTPPSASQRPKPTTDGQAPKRPTRPPELLPPRPTLSTSQTPKEDSPESSGGQQTGSYFGPTDPADINPEGWPTQDGDGNHQPLILPDDETE